MTLANPMLFILDFDGTVAPLDTVDALLEQFAEPQWRAIEEQWVRGEINSQQCMTAQIALVRGERPVLEEFLRAVEIDPSFADFVHYVRQFADLAVVSDGLDHPIHHALRRRLRVPIPIYANRLDFRDGGLRISFPYGDRTCAVGSGVCKCAVARAVDAGRGLTTILIGDGRSDLCLARSADFVFAKGALRRYCLGEGIVHAPFESFGDVLTIVRGWNAQDQERIPEEAACHLVPS
ncbi:MAG: 2,3-diketo-5-methylthio-1-phosphopentane phosphatase [Acidobacteria bacterium]|nr:2,3-diketo-5-methylthio-1-phosphopentane phosphatase [Acidobacteriota bacterium]